MRWCAGGSWSLMAVPLAVGAEQPGKVIRIGILGNVPLTDPEGTSLWGAFIQGLREPGRPVRFARAENG
jgi:hypothetical protein